MVCMEALAGGGAAVGGGTHDMVLHWLSGQLLEAGSLVVGRSVEVACR